MIPHLTEVAMLVSQWTTCSSAWPQLIWWMWRSPPPMQVCVRFHMHSSALRLHAGQRRLFEPRPCPLLSCCPTVKFDSQSLSGTCKSASPYLHTRWRWNHQPYGGARLLSAVRAAGARAEQDLAAERPAECAALSGEFAWVPTSTGRWMCHACSIHDCT